MSTHAQAPHFRAPLISLLAAGLLLTGCGGSTHDDSDVSAAATSDTPPRDFTLAFTVFAKPGASRRAVLPPERRPARYILEPDWILRAAVGPGASDETYPRQTRRLSAEEVASVWRELRDSGLLLPNHPSTVGRVVIANPDAWSDDESEVPLAPPAYSIYYGVDGTKRTIALQPGDEGAGVALVKKLAELAWVE